MLPENHHEGIMVLVLRPLPKPNLLHGLVLATNLIRMMSLPSSSKRHNGTIGEQNFRRFYLIILT